MAKGVVGKIDKTFTGACKGLGMNSRETRRAKKTGKRYCYDVAVRVGADLVEDGVRAAGRGVGCLLAKGYYAASNAVSSAASSAKAAVAQKKSAKQAVLSEQEKINAEFDEEEEDYTEV